MESKIHLIAKTNGNKTKQNEIIDVVNALVEAWYTEHPNGDIPSMYPKLNFFNGSNSTTGEDTTDPKGSEEISASNNFDYHVSGEEIDQVLKDMPQYHLDRELFTLLFNTFIDSEYSDSDEYDTMIHGTGRLGEFYSIHNEDEHYIFHYPSGMMINFYKHLGRTNTCNQIHRGKRDYANFFMFLNEYIKDHSLTNKINDNLHDQEKALGVIPNCDRAGFEENIDIENIIEHTLFGSKFDMCDPRSCKAVTGWQKSVNDEFIFDFYVIKHDEYDSNNDITNSEYTIIHLTSGLVIRFNINWSNFDQAKKWLSHLCSNKENLTAHEFLCFFIEYGIQKGCCLNVHELEEDD